MIAGRLTPTLVVVLLLLTASRARGQPVFDEPLLAHGDGSLLISLRGGTGRSSWGRAETTAMLEVVVPLDRFAAPRLGEGYTAPGQHQEEPRIQRAPVLDARMARDTLRAALVANGYASALQRLDSMSGRARSSATLPEVRLRAARSTDESLRLTPTSTDPYRYTQAGGSTLWFEARLTWRLDRLVFASEELSVERLRRDREQARFALVQKVLTTLFAWQRAVLKSTDPALLAEERAQATLDALEAELTLDVLTGGWFGAEIERRGLT